MIRFVSSRPVKLAVFGLSVVGASSAFACPRPSGGGYGGGYSRPVQYAQPHYHVQPQYRPAQQPYVQPYGQPSIPPQQMFPQQPTGGFAQGQPIQGQQFPGQVQQGQNFPQGQPMQQGQTPQGQPMQQQPQQFASAPQGASAPQQAPVQQSVPTQQQNVAPQGVPQQTAQAPATQSPAAAADADASMTALQILAGMSAPPAPAQTTSIAPTQSLADSRVGTWVAKLGNGASIRLDLRADGSFLWTATQDGKTSSFQGSYAFADESLTLARSTDNQKLAGKLTSVANGFNFKLDGSSDSGLDFVRG